MPKFRRFGVLSLLLILALTGGNVRADSDLTGLVNSAFLTRTEDAGLHELAHQRAQYQVAYSGGDCGPGSLTHEGLTTHEVLACNYTGPERAVQQWIESPTHAVILADPRLRIIGCGTAVGSEGALFYACVLTWGDSPPPQAPVPAPPAEVPPSLAPQADSFATDPLVEQADTPALLPNTATDW